MSQMLIAEKSKVLINGVEILPLEESDLCECGKESEYAGHGFRNGEMYSEYHCRECFHRRER